MAVSAPPTTERGYLNEHAVGFLPSWGQMMADDLEDNNLLIFPENVRSYTKMLNTDAQIQGLASGCLWPIYRMRWYLEPNNALPEAVEKLSADLGLPVGRLEPGQEDEPTPQRRTSVRFKFLEHLENALQAVLLGVKVFEQTGYIGDDGLFHYKKLADRPGQTIADWSIARDGGLNWIQQHGGPQEKPIPIDRLVVYTFQRRGANWTGRSLLRACYGPWLLKDRAMRIGVMNLQRAGVGTPIAEAPPGASDNDILILNRMMEKFKAGDRSGGAVPAGAKVRLVGVEGTQPDAVGFVKLMNEEMARAFLQMFMQLGQSASGSRALGSAFIDWHKMTLEYIANWYAENFNEHVIEDYIDWNWPNQEFAPLVCWQWDEEDPSAEDPTSKLRDDIKDGKVQAPSDVEAVIENSRGEVARRRERRPTRAARGSAPGVSPSPARPPAATLEMEVAL